MKKVVLFVLIFVIAVCSFGCKRQELEKSNEELREKISGYENTVKEKDRIIEEKEKIISEKNVLIDEKNASENKYILSEYDIDKSIENFFVDSHTYKHVVIIGVDGAGDFFKEANTPHVDSIFKNRISTDFCVVSNPTISAQSWGSLLTGVIPQKHQRTNSLLAQEKYDIEKYPTVFKMMYAQNNQVKMASYCEWKNINLGLIEEGVEVDKRTGNSEEIKNAVVKRIKDDIPDLFFIQFDSVDHCGHLLGYGSKLFMNQIAIIDGYIGEIYKAIEDNGYSDETLFIVTSDHGGMGNEHGGNSEQEKYVYFGAAGKYIPNCKNILMTIRDIAGVTMYSLGYKGNEEWIFYDSNSLNVIEKSNMLFYTPKVS